jgi:amino-acid N-acetyltransferase
MTSTAVVSLETMAAADLPAVLDLLAALNLPLDGFADYVGAAVVARIGEDLVGSAALEIYGKSALLRSVAVSTAMQGMGVGHRLVDAALALAKDTGIERVYLLTETAASFFPRFGFQVIDRAAVDAAVKQSVEFTSACPASATVMVREVR